MSTNWSDDLKELHAKFDPIMRESVKQMDSSTRREFLRWRVDFLQEELTELRLASTSEDVVDALIDLCVVAIGTLEAFDVDIQKAWEVVHRANMSKTPGSNAKRSNDFNLPDLVKPAGWEGPCHADNTGLFDSVFMF